MLACAGVRRDTPGRDSPFPKRPEKTLVPELAIRFAHVLVGDFCRFEIGQRTRYPLERVVDRLIDDGAVLRGEPVLVLLTPLPPVLDENCVEEKLRYKLTMALIETARSSRYLTAFFKTRPGNAQVGSPRSTASTPFTSTKSTPSGKRCTS